MGRYKKPLYMQTGHLTKLQTAQKKQEEDCVKVGKDMLLIPPKYLADKKAKDEYKRITAELDKTDMVGNLDINNIAGYCNAYSFYLKATKELKGQPLTEKRIQKDGSEITVENPLINIQKKYADEMRKFASMCGLTIDSRLKQAVVKVNKDDTELERKFGAV